MASDSGDSLRQLILKAFLLCAVYLGNIGISVNDEQKIAALHGIHDTLEHLTLQHASTKRVERGLKEAPNDTEIKAAFRSQDLSG